MRLVEDLFKMSGGYVLDFTNQTFSEFFNDELGVNIDDTRYYVEGSSKAKRLRYFLRSSKSELVVKTLLALWQYREATRRSHGSEETIIDAENQLYEIVKRIGGLTAHLSKPETSIPPQSTNLSTYGGLKIHLLQIEKLDPQARGYAFERFLKSLFEASGLSPRASFRIVGEQIDGSFEMQGETYLLEAKWTGPPVGVNELRSFNSKVEDKAAWSRGLLVSYNGFSVEGLIAFGKGKRVVCMDGLDLYDMLERGLSFTEVMSKKVRRAAEVGSPFVRIRDLC